MTTLSQRCTVMRELHRTGCFVIPNPWDAGSARYLVALGFHAVATTSAGFAWSIGSADNRVTREQALAHMRAIASSVEVPVHADFENGFAIAPGEVGANVAAAAKTGVAALSIEDSTGDVAAPLYSFALAVERIQAARESLDAHEPEIMLTARSEGFIAGRPDLDETLRRLAAFAAAGADCLYAPGIKDHAAIAEVVKAVAPKPVNVLVNSGFATVPELAALGVRRISVGGALARVAWTGFIAAAREIAEHGTFEALGRAVPSQEMERVFGTERK